VKAGKTAAQTFPRFGVAPATRQVATICSVSCFLCRLAASNVSFPAGNWRLTRADEVLRCRAKPYDAIDVRAVPERWFIRWS